MVFSPFRHAGSVIWKRKPIQLTFFLTRRCNARCSFCFYRSSRREGGEGSGPALSLDEIERVSSSMGELLWLALSGGEIYLREDLEKIAEVFYRNNRPSMILLPTNGLLPDVIREKTEAVLRACPRSIVTVKLSLDGPPALHDSLRGVRGAFGRAMETYEQLTGLMDRYRNFELGINTVFCAGNQRAMDVTAELAGRLNGIRTHTVSLIRGEVQDPSLKEIDPELYRRTIDRLAHGLAAGKQPVYRFRGARIKAAQDVLQRKLILRTLREKRRLISCYAGKLNLVLNENGDLFPCEAFDGRLGNVRERGYDVTRVLNSAEGRRSVEKIRRGGCYCTHECYFMTNILFNPALYPSLLREYCRQRFGSGGTADRGECFSLP